MADAQPSPDQLDVVQHPLLGTLKFPKDMPYAQRNQIIEDQEKLIPNAQQQAHDSLSRPIQQDQPTMARRAAGPLLDVGDVTKGAAKGGGHTLVDIANFINEKPFLNADSPLLKPTNTAQKIGYGGEQMAEYLLPASLEEKGIGATKKILTNPTARAVAKAGIEGLSSGIVGKAQGGDFLSNFGTGALFSGLGTIGQTIAPAFIQKSLGIGAKQLRRGATPGEAVLHDLPGAIRPATIATEAKDAASKLTTQMESMVHAASQAGATADVRPAAQIVKDELDKALTQNLPADSGLRPKLRQLWRQISVDESTGKNLPRDIGPDKLLSIKRGIGNTINSWTKEEQIAFEGIKQRVYGAIDRAIDASVPGTAEINQKISSMIVAAKGAKKTSEMPMTLGRALWRIGSPIAAPAAGATLGYEAGGAPGAAIGAAAGELAASPSARIAAARTIANHWIERIGRAGIGSQLRDIGP